MARKNRSHWQSGKGSTCIDSYRYDAKSKSTKVKFTDGSSHSYKGLDAYTILEGTKRGNKSLGKAFNKDIR